MKKGEEKRREDRRGRDKTYTSPLVSIQRTRLRVSVSMKGGSTAV